MAHLKIKLIIFLFNMMILLLHFALYIPIVRMHISVRVLHVLNPNLVIQ